ncbi:TIGR04211 family SH3 domain-containing protein [Marinimicrobium sp. ABcell2]|uniref:TIGR04211 family SH3 domain-containing protein n=1 Tax=Marinimicrobium sp. ABcell2 TaxID=3069751 RepID=UPI0027B7E898|nr:TIGR04211 family SH3 domain-containing protein [Marinimicrobium sp. ABcell2]MDQ2075552.1 TIGR04211 family SH3 domain-containing protein [Marinimicrobium sp. ABcell2]
MKTTTMTLLACVLWLPLMTPAHAQEGEARYISDVLHVPLRSGMGNQFRIVHRGLRSGTQVEVIREEEDADGNAWTLIRPPRGEEGWVQNQYLLNQPTAAQQLEAAQTRAQRLTNEMRALERTITELRGENSTLEQTLAALRSEHQGLQAEFEELRNVSSDALNLHQQHQDLNEAYQMLQTRADVIQAENEQLRNDRRYYEWMFGGGILFTGVILSLILQAIGKRRRKSEWG